MDIKKEHEHLFLNADGENTGIQLYHGLELCKMQQDIVAEILYGKNQEVVINAGRAFGKDLTIGVALHDLCALLKPGTQVLFVCPYHSQTQNFYQQVLNGKNLREDDPCYGEYFIPQTFEIVGKEVRFFDNPISGTFNGSKIKAASAENPKSIRSGRADIIVINEAAFIPESIILNEVIPVLKRGGKIVYISTPNGKNWFYHKFVKGMRDPNHENYVKQLLDPKVKSFYATYKDNPKAATDYELNARIQPKKVFQRETLARFMDDNSIFTDLDKAFFECDYDNQSGNELWIGEEPIKADKSKNIPEAKYVMAVDWAKINDFTVIFIMNILTGKIVYYRRMQKVDYNRQCLAVLEASLKYNQASIVYDATGVGVAVGDILGNLRLKKEYSMISLFPKTFTNEFKKDIILNLATRIETPDEYQCFIPNIQQIVHEMTLLEMKESELGALKFAASKGEKDDCVMSLALVNWLWKEQRQSVSIGEVRFI